MLRVVKQADEWVFDRLSQLPLELQPKFMDYEDGRLTYDFIQGYHPTQYGKALDLLYRAWQQYGPGDYLPIDKHAYVSYCISLIDRTEYLSGNIKERLSILIAALNTMPLSPVRWCHGDATFHNMIMTGHESGKLIDPGDCRGLPCRELDEAKMLTSYEGFDVVTYGAPQPEVFPRPSIRPVHLVLLASHYLRLLHHNWPGHVLKFAIDRINEICTNAHYWVNL